MLSDSVHMQQPPPPQETTRPVRPPAPEGELIGRGRQKTAPGAVTTEGSYKITIMP